MLFITWGFTVSFDWQFPLSHFTSTSQSKWPILQTILSSSICSKCSPRIMLWQPVAVTKRRATLTACSTVVTSYPVISQSHTMITVDKSKSKIKSLRTNSIESSDSLFIRNKNLPYKYSRRNTSFKILHYWQNGCCSFKRKEKSIALTTYWNCFSLSPSHLPAIHCQIHNDYKISSPLETRCTITSSFPIWYSDSKNRI
jgi:hypothetical protein